MQTIKGPAIFLAQFAGDEAPFNSLDSIAAWAASLGFKGLQIPSWDARLIDLMPPDVIFINTSRGFVVDATALAAFLAHAPDAVALLDVHEPEPITAANPLLSAPNAHLHPHLASRTKAAIDAMSWVVRDVVAVLDGETPEHPAG